MTPSPLRLRSGLGRRRPSSPVDTLAGVFGTTTWRSENGEGAWQGTHSGFSVIEDGVGWGSGATLVLAGEGDDEGLRAALDVSDTRDMRGVLLPAPPSPVPAAR